MTPQDMLKTLLSPDYDGDGKLANDFLAELGRTVPLESLSLLLTSANERTRATGAFLATFQDRNINAMIGDLAGRFGLGLAGQPQYVVVDRFVEWAQASPDPEISSIASRWFEKSLLPCRAVWQSRFPFSAKRQALEDEPSLPV